MKNEVIQAIESRRTVKSFSQSPISDEDLSLVLEGGRWAPSWLNLQPWKFIVIRDSDVKKRICSHVPLFEKAGITEAPVCIAVCVEEYDYSSHLSEDGASATFAMALAAHSLGLGTYWVGVYDRQNRRNSPENKIRKLLKIPRNYRLVSLMPLGVPSKLPESERKCIDDIVCFEGFSQTSSASVSAQAALQQKLEVEKAISFSDQIDPEMSNIRK